MTNREDLLAKIKKFDTLHLMARVLGGLREHAKPVDKQAAASALEVIIDHRENMVHFAGESYNFDGVQFELTDALDRLTYPLMRIQLHLEGGPIEKLTHATGGTAYEADVEHFGFYARDLLVQAQLACS